MMVHSFHLRRAVPAVAFLAVLVLGGCGDSNLSRSFGLTRDAPDEFSVTTQQPLSMPPNFNLRAPDPGAARPQDMRASAGAEAVLVPGAAGAGAAAMSPGQQALVQEAGPPAPDNIRQRVDRDAALAATDRSFTDTLMFWRTPPKPGVVVDPTRESQRIRTNAALGQSQEQGETPIIQRKQKSFWDSIL
ncbi:MAG TPA: DUF3035 domain-containing protein [Acetobacteraceae bacterium]|nr:DUF3035 domain-containing protein [Acetobacteraceae bacterium]